MAYHPSPHQGAPISQQPQPLPTTVFVQPVQQQTYRASTESLPYLKAHVVLGILQMVFGVIAASISAIGIAIGSPAGVTGTGIYTGVFYFIAGILGFRAGRTNSRCLVIACMVMCLLAALVSLIGLLFGNMERQSTIFYMRNKGTEGTLLRFQLYKCGVVIAVCSIEVVVSVIHCGFTCATCCRCCPSQQSPPIYAPAPTTNQAVTYQIVGQQTQAYQPMIQSPVVIPPPQNAPITMHYPPRVPYSAATYPQAQPGYSATAGYVPAQQPYMHPPPLPRMPSSDPMVGASATVPSAPPPYEAQPLPPKM